MAHDFITVNAPTRRRNWSKTVAISLSDSTDNCLLNSQIHYPYITNVGTAGVVTFTWEDGTTGKLYFSQGEVIEGGHWRRAMVTGTGAGVELWGLVG